MATTSDRERRTDAAGPLHDATGLVRSYVRIGVVAIVAVVGLCSYGIYRVSLGRIITDAENEAVALAEALMDHETSALIARGADGAGELRLDPAAAPAIDAGFRKYLHHFEIITIKVFDRQARIVYSTDPALIGREDPDNPRLQTALAGRSSSHAVAGDDLLDFHGQEKFGVDVVETYVPVRTARGRVIGSIELYRDVTPYRRELGPVVAVSVAIMVLILGGGLLVSTLLLRREARALKRVQEILRDQANTDHLTGVYNRRLLLERCAQELARRGRLAETGDVAGIGFAMIDVDHFKRVNDTHGHAVGDEVIRHVAACLSGAIRPYDFVGRYGGDEFVVVFPDLAAERLAPVVTRLLDAVRTAPAQHRGVSFPMTIGVGVAVWRPGDERAEDILKRADEALYQAKRAGRDTVRYAACAAAAAPPTSGPVALSPG